MTSGTTPREIRTIDLFAGCGGLTEGFRSFRPSGESRSPYRPVAAVEMEHWAAATYMANFGGDAAAGEQVQVNCKKIEDWNPKPFANGADVILGGPPCQGFSGLGNGDPKGEKNHLWREYMRVVRTVEPKVFVIENVDRFLRSSEYADLFEASEKPDGELKNYHLETKVLNAADYGVAQRRRRVIVLATRRDVIAEHGGVPLRHPNPTHAKPKKGSPAVSSVPGLEPWISVGPAVFAKTDNATDYLDLPERVITLLDKELPGPYATSELHIGRTPSEHSLLRYAAIPAGGNRHDLPEELSTPNWIAHRTGSGDVMGRMHEDQPSVTIRTEFYKPEKGRYLHPSALRPITHLEAAMIQGFPLDFKWCGSKVQIARQIGNAVPIGLGRKLAEQIYNYLYGIGDLDKPYQPMIPTAD